MQVVLGALVESVNSQSQQLSHEFDELQEKHPEVYKSEQVNKILDFYVSRLKTLSTHSIPEYLKGLSELNGILADLVFAAKYHIQNSGEEA